MLVDHCLCLFSALPNYLLDLLVNHRLNSLSVRLSILGIRKSNIPKFSVHSELRHEVVGQVVGLLEVVVGSCCHFIKEVKLGASSSQNKTNSIKDLLFSLELVLIQKILSKS